MEHKAIGRKEIVNAPTMTAIVPASFFSMSSYFLGKVEEACSSVRLSGWNYKQSKHFPASV